MKKIHLLIYVLSFCVAFSCRKGEPVDSPETETVYPQDKVSGGIHGLFVINEGNMGSNKASIDYYSYDGGTYTRNIFGHRNPDIVKGLGDVARDIAVNGNRLYVTVNGSGYIEVMNLSDAVHVDEIPLASAGYMAFDDRYLYVSSYSGPLEGEQRKGMVVRINLADYAERDTCPVGYQPEEMAVYGGKLYVANSGGYMAPDYETTVSVIDLASFTESSRIEVGINLHRMVLAENGMIYVSSRGNYADVPSKLFVIDAGTDKVIREFSDVPCTDMTLADGRLYIYSSVYSYETNGWTSSYSVLDTRSMEVSAEPFIKDGSETSIVAPYGIAVHPVTGDIYITDAKDYVSSGTIRCYGKDGKKKWECTAGNIPAAMVFTSTALK